MKGNALVAGDCLTEGLGGKTAENGGALGTVGSHGDEVIGGYVQPSAVSPHGLRAHPCAQCSVEHADGIAAEIHTAHSQRIYLNAAEDYSVLLGSFHHSRDCGNGLRLALPQCGDVIHISVIIVCADIFKRKEVEHRKEEIAHVLRSKRTYRHPALTIGQICVDNGKQQGNGSLALIFLTDLFLQSWFEDVGIKLLAVVFHHCHLECFSLRCVLLVKHLYPVGYIPYILAHLFARTQAAAPLD